MAHRRSQTAPIIPDQTSTSKPLLRVLGVIPARLASTRLPGKVLRLIAGKPMLQWVVEAARRCPQLDELIVATDSEEVATLCRTRGWPVRLTSPTLPSGSDRVQAIAREIPAHIYVNIQGDEPLLRPEHLSALLLPFEHPDVEVSTLRVPCTPENINNPNAVKVVTAADGRALYFSRAPIPHHRDHQLHHKRTTESHAIAPSETQGEPAVAPDPSPQPPPEPSEEAAQSTRILLTEAPTLSTPQYWKHIGLYAYRAAALQRFTALPPSLLEQIERLEQLRFLENNIPVHVATTTLDTVGVDTEADLQLVAYLLAQQT